MLQIAKNADRNVFKFSVAMMKDCFISGAHKSMVMKNHGNVRGEVRVNVLALLVMCDSLTLFRIVRASVRLNIAVWPIPNLLWSLIIHA